MLHGPNGGTSELLEDFFFQNPRPKYSGEQFWVSVQHALKAPASPAHIVVQDTPPNIRERRGGGKLSIDSIGRKVVWLHLSDLYLCPSKTGWDADRVLAPLGEDLKLMEKQYGLCPDLLFFTGDLSIRRNRKQCRRLNV